MYSILEHYRTSVSYDVTDMSEFEIQYLELKYQPDTWLETYRVLLKATRQTDELLFNHKFLITNLYSIRVEDAFNMYRNRGPVEKASKKSKMNFSWIKLIVTAFK